ncbi:MAG TPA: asparagine synthase-related protein [Chthonomonadales bacterium]|nr:asparagine synthase-related protein [Chthonomonadales bacterium]
MAGAAAPGPVSAASCADLLLTFDAAPPARGDAWSEPGAGTLLSARAGAWPGYPCLRASDAHADACLLGELYGERDPAAAALAVARGDRPAASLNGHWLLVAWRPGERRWHVWTDRFGTLHAYHAESAEGAALGTCFRDVARAASRRSLDLQAIAGFCALGFFPFERTHFTDVRIVPPAIHLVLDEAGRARSQERTWHWRHEPDNGRSYDGAVAEFGERFEAVMQELLSDARVAVPISGGLDSRCTVAAVREPSDNLWAYSYGYTPQSVETRIARSVAEARRLRFEAFTIEPYLFDRLEEVLASVEGFQDVTQCRQAAVTAALARNADRVIAAHWGDVWLDDMGLAGRRGLPEIAVAEHALHKMEKPGGEWLASRLRCADHGREWLLEGLRQRLRGLEHIEDPDFRVKALKTDLWSFRWTLASVRMYMPGAFPRLPFYDTRLADLFSTVPTEETAGRRLQIDYLRRAAPDLARIEWQATGADLYGAGRTASRSLPARAARRALRALTGRPAIQRNWEVQFLSEPGRALLRHHLLRPGLRIHDLFPRAEIAALVERLRAGRRDGSDGYAASMLLTLSAWLERHAV